MSRDTRHEEAEILRLVADYAARRHAAMRPGAAADAAFVPGETPVPYAGRVFGAEEVSAAVSAVLDFWLTLGPHGEKMETALASTAFQPSPAIHATRWVDPREVRSEEVLAADRLFLASLASGALPARR